MLLLCINNIGWKDARSKCFPARCEPFLMTLDAEQSQAFTNLLRDLFTVEHYSLMDSHLTKLAFALFASILFYLEQFLGKHGAHHFTMRRLIATATHFGFTLSHLKEFGVVVRKDWNERNILRNAATESDFRAVVLQLVQDRTQERERADRADKQADAADARADRMEQRMDCVLTILQEQQAGAGRSPAHRPNSFGGVQASPRPSSVGISTLIPPQAVEPPPSAFAVMKASLAARGPTVRPSTVVTIKYIGLTVSKLLTTWAENCLNIDGSNWTVMKPKTPVKKAAKSGAKSVVMPATSTKTSVQLVADRGAIQRIKLLMRYADTIITESERTVLLEPMPVPSSSEYGGWDANRKKVFFGVQSRLVIALTVLDGKKAITNKGSIVSALGGRLEALKLKTLAIMGVWGDEHCNGEDECSGDQEEGKGASADDDEDDDEGDEDDGDA